MQVGGRHGIGDRDALGHRYVAGVEPGIHLHHHHADVGIARHDGAIDRRGAAPARQQRGVQIETTEPRRIENGLRQDHAIGDHHGRIGAMGAKRFAALPPSSASPASARQCRAAAPPAPPAWAAASCRARPALPHGYRPPRSHGHGRRARSNVGTAKSGVPMKIRRSGMLLIRASVIARCYESLFVMPALVAGIHVLPCRHQGVDGRDEPGHDGSENRPSHSAARLAALVNFFSTRSRFSFDR